MKLTDRDTPFVRIDVPTVRANIDAMSAHARSKGIALRPHAKTHKLIPLAKMQLDAGVVGLTVATIGEAEAFAPACPNMFIAFPVWPSDRAKARVKALIDAGVTLSMGVDSPITAAAWAQVAGLSLMVEVDSGHHRSGVLPADAAQVAAAAPDRVAGVFTFPGHSYAPGAGAGAALDESSALTTAANAIVAAVPGVANGSAAGLLRSGGSTPSAAEAVDIDEIRPGVYPFYDAQQLALGRCSVDDVALTVTATVVSKREDLRQVVLDAGSKILGSDKHDWTQGYGLICGADGAFIKALSEHHATVSWPEGMDFPELGQRLSIIPNHVCLVANLVDSVVAVESDGSIEEWSVDARGRNS